jgi:hypothetical protein
LVALLFRLLTVGNCSQQVFCIVMPSIGEYFSSGTLLDGGAIFHYQPIASR